MLLRIIFVVCALVLIAKLTGCGINDPNYNDKIRFQMAKVHAERVLKSSGSELTPHAQHYDLMIFWRKHWDAQEKVLHRYQLYDFLKVSDQAGPNRFVIAYDDVTKRTYLRTDLRSNVNVDSLPTE